VEAFTSERVFSPAYQALQACVTRSTKQAIADYPTFWTNVALLENEASKCSLRETLVL
jgi:hypothetical protein